MPDLQTERLFLREFVKSDWKAVHEYASDPEVVRFLEWGPNAPDETIAFLEGTLQCQRERPRRIYEFAITLKNGGKLIGACGLRLHDADNEQADMGYCFNRLYWRQGYASEAAKAVLGFGFEELNLNRIIATCDSFNLGSAGVLRSCGMRQEGHFIQERRVRGEWRDTLQFAILKDEFLTKKANPAK